MGAVGAMNDAELRARLKGYVNLESTGSTGPAILFESGPGNEALIRAWANGAPRPHGASFALEIYKRLPNDTDFTILKAAGIPGLNMAPVGNSHAYHTSRDTADRVAVGHAAPHGRERGHDDARDGRPGSPEGGSRRPLRLGWREHGDRAGRLAGPAPLDPGDRPRPRGLDPDRPPPRRRRRDPLHRHRAVGDPGARLRRRRDGRRIVAAGRVERRPPSLVRAADAGVRAARGQRRARSLAADAPGTGRAGAGPLPARAGQHLGADPADLGPDHRGVRDQGAARVAAVGGQPGPGWRGAGGGPARAHDVDARRVGAGAGRDHFCCSSATA